MRAIVHDHLDRSHRFGSALRVPRPPVTPLATQRAALLRFYDAHARDLPWRRTRDPYAIWVSEVMLQQTRVETVLGYYDRFLSRFPTTHALAAAAEDEVLAAWSGLGYYRRARLLHAGVREVVAQYGGAVPEAAEARLALKGVGRYTAGAIGSIAFGKQEPLVDGNVARVLSRLRGIDTPLGRSDTESRLWAEAEALCKGPRPGALNQALMELGATVCSKTSPACERCPVRRACVAHAQDRTHLLPVARKKKAPRAVELVMLAVVDHPRRKLVLQRGQGELFGGLWNLPMCEGEGGSAARGLLDALSVNAQLAREPIATFEHVLTHRHLHVTLYTARLAARARVGAHAARKLVGEADLATLGVSRLTRKAVDHALVTY
jgi:A/G-specific adenine glycosylase